MAPGPFFLLKEDELGDWDRFVQRHECGTIYHLSNWKGFLEEVCPHVRGEYVALRNTNSGDIVAGIPLYIATSSLLGTRMISTPFATLGGALVSSAGDMARLRAAIWEIAARAGARRLEIRGLRRPNLTDLKPLAPSSQFLHHFLELPDSPEKLRPRFSRVVRRNIAKAVKGGVRIVEDNSTEALNKFSLMHQSERKRLGLPAFPAHFFQALQKHLPPPRLSVLVAVRQTEVLGMFLVLEHQDWSIAEYIVVTESGREQGAGHLLYWESMVRSIEAGRKFYSLGRTAPDRSGLLQFKRSWGGIEETLMTLTYPTPHSSLMFLSSNPLAGQLARFFFRNVPAALSRTMSSFFYSHWA